MNEGAIVSELMYQKDPLTPEQLLKALLRGDKIKNVLAPRGVNFYLENGQLKSEKITYLKGLPMDWFNPDIRHEIDD